MRTIIARSILAVFALASVGLFGYALWTDPQLRLAVAIVVPIGAALVWALIHGQ